MKIRDIIPEVYSRENIGLHHFMKNERGLDIWSYPVEVLRIIVRDYPEEGERLLSQFGITEEEFDEMELWYEVPGKLQDAVYEFIQGLPAHDKRKIYDEIINELSYQDYDGLTSTHFDTFRINRLLPRTTWLIHFSDNASNIKRDGFRYGQESVAHLGITSQSPFGSDSSGFNFAYVALDPDSFEGEKYGREAVMFQNSAQVLYHHGDSEYQAIFYGPDVSPKNMVLIERDGGDWVVRNTKTGRTIFSGDLKAVQNWVVNNFAQYRNVIT